MLLLVFVSCKTNQSSELSKTQEDNISIAKQVYTYFNKHDWQGMAGLYKEPAEFKDPSFGQEAVMQTRKQIVEKYKGLESMFPDVKDEIVNVYPSGEKNVIVEFISTGSNNDGTRWKLPICTIFTIESGKIVKDYNYYDENPAKK
ncbi:MAG: nuclear transport factor 2 family protein [Ignavibacteria bacterium]|nr:nuclear transport factor 2 family protein [Ignavibacteria bacterium]